MCIFPRPVVHFFRLSNVVVTSNGVHCEGVTDLNEDAFLKPLEHLRPTETIPSGFLMYDVGEPEMSGYAHFLRDFLQPLGAVMLDPTHCSTDIGRTVFLHTHSDAEFSFEGYRNLIHALARDVRDMRSVESVLVADLIVAVNDPHIHKLFSNVSSITDAWMEATTLGCVRWQSCLTNTLLDFVGVTELEPSRRIWMSRADAQWRRVLNEDELLHHAALTSRGFEV
jgi:hypothetical protein